MYLHNFRIVFSPIFSFIVGVSVPVVAQLYSEGEWIELNDSSFNNSSVLEKKLVSFDSFSNFISLRLHFSRILPHFGGLLCREGLGTDSQGCMVFFFFIYILLDHHWVFFVYGNCIDLTRFCFHLWGVAWVIFMCFHRMWVSVFDGCSFDFYWISVSETMKMCVSLSISVLLARYRLEGESLIEVWYSGHMVS